jgi:hypothetical protein
MADFIVMIVSLYQFVYQKTIIYGKSIEAFLRLATGKRRFGRNGFLFGAVFFCVTKTISVRIIFYAYPKD